MSPQLEKLLQAQQESKAAMKAAQLKIRELQLEIKRGSDSTGDPVKDYVIAAFGMIGEPNIEDRLKRWQEVVEQHQGEQVLAVGETYQKHGEDGCFSSSYYLGSDRYLQLGVINGPLRFDYGQDQIIVPTGKTVKNGSRFVTSYHSEWQPQWKLHSEPIIIEDDDLLVSRRNSDRECSRFEVLIGNELVGLYFKVCHSYQWVYHEHTLNEIAKGPKQYPLDDRPDLSYVPALELLGVEIPFNFKLAADKANPQRQEKFFREIYELSLKPETEPQALKQKLEYALQVGIHEKPIAVDGSRRGISIHSIEFLRGLCEEHQIPMPKKKKQE